MADLSSRGLEMRNGGRIWRRVVCSRPIPKRGQVKVAIVMDLAHSFASIFSLGARSQSCRRR